MQTLITNWQWRDFTYGCDVPARVLMEEYSHLDEPEVWDSFFEYRGRWYHLSDFMQANGQFSDLAGNWHGFHADSFFSGVLVELSDDGESYRVATVIA